QLGELTELEDEVGLQRDISELLWERLDEKFANLWSEGRAVSNFGKVYKKADESVLSFCGRVQELGETLPSLSSSDVRNQILRGLPGGLVVKLKQYFGPRLYSEPLSNEKNNKAQGSGNGGSDAKPNSGNSTGRGAMAVDIDQGLIDIAAVEEKQSQELRSLTLATACPPSTCKSGDGRREV
ncbi:hypothetical protein FOZ60_011855, partial [Perkinsus olseni]